MSADLERPPAVWRVTYFNPVTDKRHVLIDDIDEATADAVVARFGDTAGPYFRLPDVAKEQRA